MPGAGCYESLLTGLGAAAFQILLYLGARIQVCAFQANLSRFLHHNIAFVSVLFSVIEFCTRSVLFSAKHVVPRQRSWECDKSLDSRQGGAHFVLTESGISPVISLVFHCKADGYRFRWAEALQFASWW